MKLENLLLAATLLAAPLAATASAQDAADPLTTSAGITIGNESIQVRGVEGGVEVLRNGQRMPTSRWRLQDDTVEVFDEAGKQLASLSIANLRRNWKELQARQPKAYIGVVMDKLDSARASMLPEELAGCAYVTYVVPDQPAARAGLQVGDVLIGVGGRRLADIEAVREMLSEKAPGDVVELQVLRRGKKLNLRVEMSAPPPVSTGFWKPGGEGATLGYGWGGQELLWPKANVDLNLSGENYKRLQESLLDYYRALPLELPMNTPPMPEALKQLYLAPPYLPPSYRPPALLPLDEEAAGPSAGDVDGLRGRLEKIDERLERIERLLSKLLADPK